MSTIAENDATVPETAERTSSTLGRRILSAVALAPCVLVLILLGGWPFCLLVAVAAALMLVEWDALVAQQEGRGKNQPIVYLQASALIVPILLSGAAWYLAALGVLALAVAGLALAAPLFDRSRKWLFLGMAWIALPTLALVWLRLRPEFGFEFVIGLFLAVWATDTGAYFAGRAIGGPLLAPRLSPKKTWAGLIGGALVAAVVAGIWAIWTGLASIVMAALAGIAVAAISQLGDLSESAVKRHFKVKDSGALIPGHGGLLDRVDGLLFAAPAVTLLVLLGGRGLA